MAIISRPNLRSVISLLNGRHLLGAFARNNRQPGASPSQNRVFAEEQSTLPNAPANEFFVLGNGRLPVVEESQMAVSPTAQEP